MITWFDMCGVLRRMSAARLFEHRSNTTGFVMFLAVMGRSLRRSNVDFDWSELTAKYCRKWGFRESEFRIDALREWRRAGHWFGGYEDMLEDLSRD